MTRPLTIAAFIAISVHGILAQSRPEFKVTAIKNQIKNVVGPGRGSGGACLTWQNDTGMCSKLRDLILTAYSIYADGDTANPNGFPDAGAWRPRMDRF